MSRFTRTEVGTLAGFVGALALFLLSLTAMSTATFNPFIYFRF
jgi:hypothetical protein